MMQKYFPYLLLIVIGFIVYGNTLNHGFVLDDNAIITNHKHVQAGWEGVGSIFSTNYLHGLQEFNDGLYRPVSPFAFALENDWGSGNPFVFHFFNILYVILTAVVMFEVLTHVFGVTRTLAIAGSILFLVMPVHTEVVANIKSRDELFALLFALSGLLFLDKYMKRSEGKSLILGGFFFLLALFSKESAFGFVGVFALLLWWFHRDRLSQVKKVVLLLAGSGIFFLGIRYLVLSSLTNAVGEGTISVLNNSILDASTGGERLGTALWIQALYLFKSIVPLSFQHDYSYNVIEVVSLFSVKALVGLLVLLAGVWGTWSFREKIPLISAGIVWYFGTLIIVSNLFFTIGATFAERFLYAPTFGIVLIALGVAGKYLNVEGQHKKFVLGGTVAIAILFGGIGINRNSDWKDNYTLFTADYPKLQNSARGNYNYASGCQEKANAESALNARKKLWEASVPAFNRAIEIYPEYWDAYNNLAMTYKNLGQMNNAITTLNYLVDKKPSYQKGWFNLGADYYQMKDYASALHSFEQYNQLNNQNPTALYYSALCAGFLNDFPKAIVFLEQCIRINPSHIDALLLLGKAHGLQKNFKASESYLLKVLQLDPNHQEAKNSLQITRQALQS